MTEERRSCGGCVHREICYVVHALEGVLDAAVITVGGVSTGRGVDVFEVVGTACREHDRGWEREEQGWAVWSRGTGLLYHTVSAHRMEPWTRLGQGDEEGVRRARAAGYRLVEVELRYQSGEGNGGGRDP